MKMELEGGEITQKRSLMREAERNPRDLPERDGEPQNVIVV